MAIKQYKGSFFKIPSDVKVLSIIEDGKIIPVDEPDEFCQARNRIRKFYSNLAKAQIYSVSVEGKVFSIGDKVKKHKFRKKYPVYESAHYIEFKNVYTLQGFLLEYFEEAHSPHYVTIHPYFKPSVADLYSVKNETLEEIYKAQPEDFITEVMVFNGEEVAFFNGELVTKPEEIKHIKKEVRLKRRLGRN